MAGCTLSTGGGSVELRTAFKRRRDLIRNATGHVRIENGLPPVGRVGPAPQCSQIVVPLNEYLLSGSGSALGDQFLFVGTETDGFAEGFTSVAWYEVLPRIITLEEVAIPPAIIQPAKQNHTFFGGIISHGM